MENEARLIYKLKQDIGDISPIIPLEYMGRLGFKLNGDEHDYELSSDCCLSIKITYKEIVAKIWYDGVCIYTSGVSASYNINESPLLKVMLSGLINAAELKLLESKHRADSVEKLVRERFTTDAIKLGLVENRFGQSTYHIKHKTSNLKLIMDNRHFENMLLYNYTILFEKKPITFGSKTLEDVYDLFSSKILKLSNG